MCAKCVLCAHDTGCERKGGPNSSGQDRLGTSHPLAEGNTKRVVEAPETRGRGREGRGRACSLHLKRASLLRNPLGFR